jgi:alpha-amylase
VKRQSIRLLALLLASAALPASAQLTTAQTAAPAILQWFEGSWRTMEKRAGDVFAAGYGGVWVPPASRADSGNQSVGYDVFDRFDLGSAGNPTLYGTELGLKTTTNRLQRAGQRVYLDLVLNHNGFRDSSTSNFNSQGGYPGFVLSASGTSDGDFNSAFGSGDQEMRLAGLIDIRQQTNVQLIRNPVTAGNPQNIPQGTIWNRPTEANRRFYQNRSGSPARTLFDPTTGESNIPVYDFTADAATTGTPVAENALGLLMRNTQWLVQTIGVDGFRLDATKHMPSWVLNYYDRSVYRAHTRPLLDGSTYHPFSFGEYFDGNSSLIQPTIRKDINPNDPGRIGGNRDALDFPLYFAMRDNLSSNGLANNWNNVVNATLDRNDDLLANNGSQGVAFVSSHDKDPAHLQNVAYAYVLMRPGNAIVYFNAREFGTGRAFPNNNGRGDALGGFYGDNITELVDIRARYPQGAYTPRLTEKETFIVERANSVVAGYSNRLDAGYDARTVQTAFAPGTPLIELTGNAADITIDPFNDIPELLVVLPNGQINLRVPRNRAPGANGAQHNKGYVIYGPSGPQGNLTIQGAAFTLAPQTATDVVTNATARTAPIDVVTGNSFTIRLQTNQVNLLGFQRDVDADGDGALFSFDAGTDINGNGQVDFRTPNTPAYGFEQFLTKSSPLFGGGDGEFLQTVNSASLSEGMHHIEVRAFRKRNSNEPVVFSSWRRTVYIDRLLPVSAVDSFAPLVSGVNENRRIQARSTDLTADNIHILTNIGAALSQSEVLALIGGASQGNQIERNLWTRDLFGVTSGNHVITLVTFELNGTVNIQRFPGYNVSTIFGAGFGDLNNNGQYEPADMTAFANIMLSFNRQFSPAADLNGDGLVDWTDYGLLGTRLNQVGAPAGTIATYNMIRRSTIPEPGMICVLAVASLALTRVRRSAAK